MAERRCLPLSVWPVAQRASRAQRVGRYLPASGAHPAKMLPATARAAIEAYSAPGDIVLDPMCGIGTTLVEAVHLGRDAVGVEYEPKWSELASANLAHAKASGASGHGEILTGDGRYISSLVDPALKGLVTLVVTSPPYGPSLHGHVRAQPGRGVTKYHCSYSNDAANLGAVGLDELLRAVQEILVGCSRLLRPGGVVALTVRPWRRRGQLVDLPGAIGSVGEQAGLVLFERNVALLAGLRDDTLVPRASFFALEHARKSQRRGVRQLVIAYEDVLVFRKPA
jgi:SAM-dependent methyltransferase